MQPEFSRIVNLDDLSGTVAVFEIEATEAERRALAARFGLQAIDRLAAVVRLKRIGRMDIGRMDVELSADIAATVVQTCVVTLEPVDGAIERRVDIRFGPADTDLAADGALVVSVEDDVEPLPEGGFDIGEIVAAELSLLLDPFPRHADADNLQEDAETASNSEEKPESPFSALAALRRKE